MRYFRKIKSYFRRIRGALDKLELTGSERIAVFFDVIWCRIRYHAKLEEYLQYHFYQFRHHYRKYFLLAYHQKHQYRRINQKGFTRSKYDFYQRIPDIFGREMIAVPDCGEAEFVSFLKRNIKAVLKPDSGSYGRDIRLLHYTNDADAVSEFRGVSGRMVCEGFIYQHEKMSQLSPDAVNTIRVQTLRYDDRVDVISATLKMGGKPGCIIDNMHNGGIGAQVDIASGIIVTLGKDYECRQYTHHPATGAQIIGFVVPNWDKAIELVKQAHSRLPECKLLGWDVAITAEGADIVEANNGPGPTLTQMMDLIPKGKPIMKLIKDSKK